MMETHEILTGVVFLMALLLVAYTYINRKELSRFIPVSELGVFERDLPNLIQVVVIANKVERPSDTLADAVENNFREKVKYLFLISNENAEKELKGYYLMFKALAEKVAAETADETITVENLVAIKKLSYEWPDVPYIFYQFRTPEGAERFTIAFRGNQQGEGIAEFYEKLPKSLSHAMVGALLSEAPEEIRIDLKLVNNVAKLKPAQNTKSRS